MPHFTQTVARARNQKPISLLGCSRILVHVCCLRSVNVGHLYFRRGFPRDLPSTVFSAVGLAPAPPGPVLASYKIYIMHVWEPPRLLSIFKSIRPLAFIFFSF
jgi:hypothetical protein